VCKHLSLGIWRRHSDDDFTWWEGHVLTWGRLVYCLCRIDVQAQIWERQCPTWISAWEFS
jgi:hypothetical protein